jgi:hypothetical protein
MRLKSHFPAPLLGLAVGVSAVAILAAIFAFQPPSPPPDRCTDAEARSIALQQFPDDPSARSRVYSTTPGRGPCSSTPCAATGGSL